MRGHTSLAGAARHCRPARRLAPHIQRRAIQITAAPTSDTPITGEDPFSSPSESSSTADARFEVIGAPYSLLSVSLSASQRLYTRRGTLVGVSGKVENAQSTLSLLEPFRRAALGIPFLYQRITSTSPITALISTKSPITSLVVVHLNGTVDWMVTQRNALLAWTGHTLSVTPRANTSMNIAHWGNSQIRGRGLVAFSGSGQIYQVTLKAGEEYVAHPGNVVAYTMSEDPPLPYRFKSSNFRFQVPDLGFTRLLQNVKFFRVMSETKTWRTVANLAYTLRTSARRTIWGDRLFLQFHGPTTLLLSSRASRISDVMTTRDVNEVADSPAGSVQDAVTLAREPLVEAEVAPLPKVDAPTGFHVASVGKDGKVKFGEAASSADDVKR
ncbi:hypothetical protein V499_08146 [Pseudogymnoascus sp. VKM F-103]|nr:hypothetical protein V499_08146 [Pseudogymnoascus sp. VKM F-103]